MNKKKVFWISAAVVVVLAAVLTTVLVLTLGNDKDDDWNDDQPNEPLLEAAWGFECISGACVKVLLTDENRANARGQNVCRLQCNKGGIDTIWPHPSGQVQMQDKLSVVNPDSISFVTQGLKDDTENYFAETRERFLGEIRHLSRGVRSGVRVNINMVIASDSPALTYETNEGYKLKTVQTNENQVDVTIEAETYYGARNGLESLSQLFVYDDVQHQLLLAAQVEFEDSPAYKHRGVHLDTSRSYYSVESIKRTINALAMVKMNTFHWHLTDSHSFPVVLKSYPELARLGAYSPSQVYTEHDIKDIVRYARVRGIRVIPEFDQPAHVGEGFQGMNLTVCFNYQPWSQYCVEPPCGQFDVTKDKLYDVLENIFADYVDYFHPLDTLFHMGGDEVFIGCWQAIEEIREWVEAHPELGTGDEAYYNLWGRFQTLALERWDRVAKSHVPIMLWTSHLTEEPLLSKFLDKDRYIIQIWNNGTDVEEPQIQTLFENGFRVIFTNVEAMYLDCGFGGWVSDGHNWCSPYVTWQKVYDNDLKKYAGDKVDLIMGAEAALWSEQTDDQSLDSRYWPRLSALAERVWTDPVTTWREAETRFIYHRQRLVRAGIRADLVQPAWCLQNENQCPV